jgi:hypothetical protein
MSERDLYRKHKEVDLARDLSWITKTTERAVLEFFHAANRDEAERNLYESTDCGAWIEFDEYRIVLGSIVEGCDFGTATYPLYYEHSFTRADIQARIDAIEAEAAALWTWANEPYAPDSDQSLMDIGCDAPDVCNEYLQLNPEGRSA